MIKLLPAIFSMLVGVAGWFYMFYSNSARRLAAIEASPQNRLRVRLRRAGGLVMIVLAACFYAAFVALERDDAATAAACLLVVFVLLIAILALGLIDLRLTQALRRSQQKRDQP